MEKQNLNEIVRRNMGAEDLASVLKSEPHLVSEGGHMFDDVTKIHQENVAATLKYIYNEILPALEIDRKWVQPLGSTGKKLPGGSSGDIDLGIDATKVHYLQDAMTADEQAEAMHQFCAPILDDMGIKWAHKGNLFSIRCPIQNFDGKQKNEFVQLDMMTSRNMKFQVWSQYAPKEVKGQKYIKGCIRNLIFEAAAHAMDSIKVLETGLVKFKDGIKEDMVEWEEYSFYTPEGLNIKHCKRELAKNKSLAEQGVHNSGNKSTRSLVTDDPDEIAKRMFGPKVKGADLMTWYGAWEAAHKAEWAKDATKWKVFLDSLKEKIQVKIAAGIDIPQEMLDELGLAKSGLVTEGGNRFEMAGKINQDNFKPTYDKLVDILKKEFGLDDDDFASTGSGGKKLGGGSVGPDGEYKPRAQSGDIDIAIRKQKVSKNMGIETLDEWIDAVQDMCDKNGLECSCSDRWGWIGACSILMPIVNHDGHQEGKFVQADLMICDNLEFQKWSKYAPAEVEGEQYVKGLVRNAILRSIAKAIWYIGDDRGTVNKRGENQPLGWTKYVFDKEGLFKAHYKRELMKGKKGEEGVYKAIPTLVEKEFITDDPDELCEILCGVDSQNMLTWKQAWDVAKKKGVFKDKDQCERFKENLEHELKYELDKGNLKYVPDEVAKFIDYDPKTFVRRERADEEFKKMNEAFKKRRKDVSELDSAKQSMKKIHQLEGTPLRMFLSDFANGFKDGSLLIKTTPKIDGAAFRIGWCDGQVYVENSRSGILKADSKSLNMPNSHKAVAKCVNQQAVDDIFKKIREMGISGVKVIGELLSNGENIVDDDGSITYVGSSYDAGKLGRIGSMVVFTASEMTSSSIKDLDYEKQQEFIDFLCDKVSDSSFSYFNLQRFAQEIKLDESMFPVETMKELRSSDPMDMSKQKAEEIRDEINKCLTDVYKREFKSPDIMKDGETLEGVVLELKGKTYGIHYDSWKEIKSRNLGLSQSIDDAFGDMVGELVGMSPTVGMGKLMTNLRANKDSLQGRYKELLPKFRQIIQNIIERGQNMDGMSKYARTLTKGKYDRFVKKVQDVPLTDDVESLIQLIDGKIEDMHGQRICLLPGSFKPPHKGHFDMVKQYAREYDYVYIGISNPTAANSREDKLGRDIPNFVSREIMETYCQAAGLENVTVETTTKPMSWMRYKLQHMENATVALGMSKKDDPSRFDQFMGDDFQKGLRNVKILPVEDTAVEPSMDGGEALSATEMRSCIDDKGKLARFLPDELSQEQVNRVFDLLNGDGSSKEVYSEGGHAKSQCPEEKRARINQENVEDTLKDIYRRLLPRLGLKKADVQIVGSTGKKLPGGTSGDIDLAMPQEKVMKGTECETPDEFLDYCQGLFDELGAYDASAPGYGWKSVSCFWPISNADGKQGGKFVQLDFVVTTNMRFITWGMHTDMEKKVPDGENPEDINPKSAVRLILLRAIAMGGSVDVKKYGDVPGEGEHVPLEMYRYDFIFNEGLFRVHRTRNRKKNGEYAKTWETEKEFVTDDPDKIVRLAFKDNSMNADDIMTVRDMYDALIDSPMWEDDDTRHEIGRCFGNIMKRQQGKYGAPTWLKFN